MALVIGYSDHMRGTGTRSWTKVTTSWQESNFLFIWHLEIVSSGRRREGCWTKIWRHTPAIWRQTTCSMDILFSRWNNLLWSFKESKGYHLVPGHPQQAACFQIIPGPSIEKIGRGPRAGEMVRSAVAAAENDLSLGSHRIATLRKHLSLCALIFSAVKWR